MRVVAAECLSQRADYTHKHNLGTGRHGWLRLTPAYSLKIVQELIEHAAPHERVLDPFCGTATTALCAAYRGHDFQTMDINPFLVWLGKIKTARFNASDIADTRRVLGEIERTLDRNQCTPAPPPPLHNIERWWSKPALLFLGRLQQAINAIAESEGHVRALLCVAFCRTLMRLSNASFNHQSMSFRDESQPALPLGFDMGAMYRQDLDFVLRGAEQNPTAGGDVILGDSRSLQGLRGKFSRVITSPPYANRMSYIRELRPYMYWLGFLVSGREAGDLDWAAIGGTWGIATSRLAGWSAPESSRFPHPALDHVLQEVASPGNENGPLLSNYIARYFADIWSHLQSLVSFLENDAEVHYIVGNSTFYGTLLPAQELYAAMFTALGFRRVQCVPLRKRNSKKELVEFDVCALAPA